MTVPLRRRIPWGWLARLALGLGLLSLALWANQEQIELVIQRRPRFSLFGLGLGLYFSGVLLSYVRWFWLVRALGLPVRFPSAIRLGFIGTLFNLLIPGAVGGDVVKAAYLVRMLHSRKTQAVASVAIDRVIGLLGLFLLAIGAGVLGWGTLEPAVRRLVGVVFVLTIAVAGVLALAFAPALYRPIAARMSRWPRLQTGIGEIGVMGAAYQKRLDVVFGTIGMATFTHVLNVLAFMVLGMAMFPAVPGLAQHFLITPLVLFSTAIPLPFGALGVSEQVSDALFLLADYKGGALTMMAFHVNQYLVSLLGLGVYLGNIRQVRTLADEAPDADLKITSTLDAEEEPAPPEATDGSSTDPEPPPAPPHAPSSPANRTTV